MTTFMLRISLISPVNRSDLLINIYTKLFSPERCPVGQYFDKIVDLCRPCGFGRYQPEEGRFTCRLCGVGLTTRTKVRARCNNFQMEVQYWSLVYAAVSTMVFYLWNAERIVIHNDSLT